MTLSTWIAFLVAAIVITCSPGPGAISSMACAVQYGFLRGIWNTLGLIIGGIFQFNVVAIGLGTILATSEIAFLVVKYLGVAYLVYLGVQQFRAVSSPVVIDKSAPGYTSAKSLVAKGILINSSNPEITLFLLAVLPQFLDLNQPLIPQYATMVLTTSGIKLIVMSIYAFLASRCLKLLSRAGSIRWANRLFGLLFILSGLFLASSDAFFK